MNSWENWYNSFLQNKKNKELEAFAAGLRGEKYSVNLKRNFDHKTNWSELISICKQDNSFEDLDYKLSDGQIISNNKIILCSFEKARRQNFYSGSFDVLNYLIFHYLSSLNIKSINDFIICIREIPEQIFTDCNNCGFTNELGWDTCKNCKIEVLNSFES